MSNQKHTTLFDDLQDPKLRIENDSKALDSAYTSVLAHLKTARKYVLDEAATELVRRLGLYDANPKEILRMLRAATPPTSVMWLEMHNTLSLTKRVGHPAKVGFLISTFDNGKACTVVLALHGEEEDRPRHTLSPLAYDIALEGTPYLPESGGVNGASAVWAYTPGTDGLAGLVGRSRVRLLTDVKYKDEAARIQDVGNILSMAPGVPRLVVAALAMLNSVPTVMVESRPRGLRLVKGQMRPYADRTTVSLNIPKRVRAHRAYALKQINKEIHRKRLHEVRGHYRHVSHKPQAPGWTAGINPITGEPCWRKSIAPHLRGDPNLGILEAPVTMVHGPRA